MSTDKKLITLGNLNTYNNKNNSKIDSKLDKKGGTIDGELIINGNLTVKGSTISKDTENISVKDNIIITNSDGVELTDNAGFAIKINTTTVYGIMYNPINDGVMIGEGIIDETGAFSYTEDEAQYLATVDWSIPGGNVPKWDNIRKTFIDSGEKIEEKANKTELLRIVRLIE